MKEKKYICRKCAWFQEMVEKEQMKLQDYVENIPEEEKVSQKEYERRLLLCDGCGELRGGLCGQCGCYVAVRAARRNKKCPHIRAKW